MTTAQKIGIAFALLILVAYLGYVSVRENGLQALRDRILTAPTITPVASVSESPSPLASVSVMPTPQTPTAAPTAVGSVAEPILESMNAQRRLAGAPDCVPHPTLQAIAQRHASDMAGRGYFSHTDPDGVTFEQRMTASGYAGTLNAENLGLTSSAAVEVVAGWMDSPGHRANVLNPQLTACGVGTATGTWQGMAVSFVVAVFGNMN